MSAPLAELVVTVTVTVPEGIKNGADIVNAAALDLLNATIAVSTSQSYTREVVQL